MKRTYTIEQLVKAAIKMGCNPQEARKKIKKSYDYYLKFKSGYSLGKAAHYCMYVAP